MRHTGGIFHVLADGEVPSTEDVDICTSSISGKREAAKDKKHASTGMFLISACGRCVEEGTVPTQKCDDGGGGIQGAQQECRDFLSCQQFPLSRVLSEGGVAGTETRPYVTFLVFGWVGEG